MEILLTAEQSRFIDSYSINKTGIPSLVLMERASLAVADEVFSVSSEMRKSRLEPRIIALCGNGNNGGDGIAAGRILYQRGENVCIIIVGPEESLSEDALVQYNIAKNMGVNIIMLTDIEFSPEWIMDALASGDIIIDALFGTGLSREVNGLYKDMIDAANLASAAGSMIFSVDIPSGINSDTGEVMGAAVIADATITFGFKKAGQIFYPGSDYCGELILADIGFDDNALDETEIKYLAFEREDLNILPARINDSNKGSYGRVLIIAGSKNMAGAAALAAKAAYKCGCGLVNIYTCESNRVILQQLVPEAVLCTYEDGEEEFLELESLLDKADAVAIGPGLGLSHSVSVLLESLLLSSEKPLILDADALNIISGMGDGDSSHYKTLLKNASKRCSGIIVTPHLKELSRLTGYNIQELKTKPDEVCEEFINQNGVICISKDARTRIYDGTGKIYVNTSGNSGMSTAGSGDVLTGILVSLAAQGLSCPTAAVCGTWLHGAAGDAAAAEVGGRSLTASDIAEGIVRVLK